MSDDRLLDVKDIHVFYGNIEAVKGLSFHVGAGEIVTLIGANGAGKTTTLRTVSGLLRPAEGAIFYEGRRVDLLPAHEVVKQGVAQAPEGRRIFPRMSVRENLDMGAFIRRDADQAKDMERVFELFPILRERSRQAAGTLSGGEQQMLAMGRALMARPKLLLLDEPSMGLAPLLVDRIFQTIREINEQGVTILLVEQNAAQALALASRGYVIETGRIVLEDDARALLTNEQVRKAYLGEE
ncbi:MAG TPA: ABC transporter ATP-binding protein [Actinomycetes bacterium]|nr:ABC transporter ATP-binding protein [Actinomycetes bacterium]